MTKEFITYEQALALKELGFDEECIGYFNNSSNKQIKLCADMDNENPFNYIVAPLYQQAFRFFRDKHNLVFNFISYNIVKHGEYHWSITWNDEAKASGIVKTYEEAEQACLDELIEIVKS